MVQPPAVVHRDTPLGEVTQYHHASVPPIAGLSRASKSTPVFTIVAEWRYALTGLGASIAAGSQK
jgi:hypothetical protein